MTLDLSHLMEVAEGATPGPWRQVVGGKSGPLAIVVSEAREHGYELHNLESVQRTDPEVWPHMKAIYRRDATYIATFDPPTVLALLDRLREAEGALRPFAKIGPSCFYPEDGSEAEVYTAVLWDGVALQDFTGADIARARAYFTPQPPSLPGRGEEP